MAMALASVAAALVTVTIDTSADSPEEDTVMEDTTTWLSDTLSRLAMSPAMADLSRASTVASTVEEGLGAEEGLPGGAAVVGAAPPPAMEAKLPFKDSVKFVETVQVGLVEAGVVVGDVDVVVEAVVVMAAVVVPPVPFDAEVAIDAFVVVAMADELLTLFAPAVVVVVFDDATEVDAPVATAAVVVVELPADPLLVVDDTAAVVLPATAVVVDADVALPDAAAAEVVVVALDDVVVVALDDAVPVAVCVAVTVAFTGWLVVVVVVPVEMFPKDSDAVADRTFGWKSFRVTETVNESELVVVPVVDAESRRDHVGVAVRARPHCICNSARSVSFCGMPVDDEAKPVATMVRSQSPR